MTFWGFLNTGNYLLLIAVILIVLLSGIIYLIGRYLVVPKIKSSLESISSMKKSMDSMEKTSVSINTRLTVIDERTVIMQNNFNQLQENTTEHLKLLGHMTETNIVEMKGIIADMSSQIAELRKIVYVILQEHYNNHPQPPLHKLRNLDDIIM